MTTKTKPKPKQAVPAYEEKPLPQGADKRFWQWTLPMFVDALSGDAYNLADVLKLMAKLPSRILQRRCRNCGGRWDGLLAQCSCIMHTACTRIHTEFAVDRLGKCKNQEHCVACCRCLQCRRCNVILAAPKAQQVPSFVAREAKYKSYCASCRSCLKCCRCNACVNCGNKIAEPCPCNAARPHHLDCCDSDKNIAKHEGLLMIKRTPKFHEGTNFQVNRGRRFLSVESEVMGFSEYRLQKLNKFARDWHCATVPEGTVPDGGEICTAPSSGNKFLELVHDLTSIYSEVGANTDNVRCGMHVHVDARDFSYSDLINLLYLYDKVEVALFALLPPWRRISRFAVPCRSSLLELAKAGNHITEQIRDVEMAASCAQLAKQKVLKPSIALRMANQLYGTQSLGPVKKHHKTSDNQSIRYMAVNLHSWVYRRTVEFRHFHGTRDEREMSLWPQILGALMDTAKRLPIRAAKRGQPSILGLSSHPIEALSTILQPRSWISSELLPFMEHMLNRWSPDFESVWQIIQNETNAVIPFQLRVPNLGIGFDRTTNYYSYLPTNNLNWQFQWGSPYFGRGRYTELDDAIARPSKKLAWLAPPELLAAKLKQHKSTYVHPPIEPEMDIPTLAYLVARGLTATEAVTEQAAIREQLDLQAAVQQ